MHYLFLSGFKTIFFLAICGYSIQYVNNSIMVKASFFYEGVFLIARFKIGPAQCRVEGAASPRGAWGHAPFGKVLNLGPWE